MCTDNTRVTAIELYRNVHDRRNPNWRRKKKSTHTNRSNGKKKVRQTINNVSREQREFLRRNKIHSAFFMHLAEERRNSFTFCGFQNWNWKRKAHAKWKIQINVCKNGQIHTEIELNYAYKCKIHTYKATILYVGNGMTFTINLIHVLHSSAYMLFMIQHTYIQLVGSDLTPLIANTLLPINYLSFHFMRSCTRDNETP